MEFEQATVLRLLGSDSYYGVPNFQRDYVWRSNTRVAEVDQLLEDLSRAFQEDDQEVYFLGSMVSFGNGAETRRMLVDGQQRTVTLILLLSAMHASLTELVAEEIAEDDEHNEEREDRLTSLRLCFRRGGGGQTNPLRFVFPDEDANQTLSTLVSSGSGALGQGRGGNRYFLVRAMNKCEQFIADAFPSLGDLERFTDFLLGRVEVVMIKTTDLTTAYRVFWTLNDRGRALTASDLLKNFLFAQQPLATRAEADSLRDTWRLCTSTLEGAGEPTPDRFLRYYLIASLDLDRVVPARQLFHTIQDHHRDLGADRPLTFARRLLSTARRYVALRRGTRVNGVAVGSLQDIREMAPTVTQPLGALLAVPERLQRGAGFIELCDCLEALALVYGVTRERWNRFESALPAITRQLRGARTSDVLGRIAESLEAQHIGTRKREFWTALSDLRNVPERTQRFLLAALALMIQEKCRATEYRSLTDVMSLSIEHIVPQGSLVTSDPEGEQWRNALGLTEAEVGRLVYALGNLTLLPAEANSMIGGKPFDVKAAAYTDEPLLMTRMIALDIRRGRSTGRRRFADDYAVNPYTSWGEDEVGHRQEILMRLIAERWPLLSLDREG